MMSMSSSLKKVVQPAEALIGDERSVRPNGTVMLVEDEAVIALDMAEDLESWSYSVIGIARTMAQVMKIAEITRPAFAIVDVSLGDGHDGVEIAQALTNAFGTNIIFLTAHTDQKTRSRIMAVNPKGYLYKPYSAFALRQILETFETD